MGTSLETIAAGGNEKLGGGDLDNILMEYCLDNFAANINIDKNTIRKNYKSMQKLKIVCEQTKKNLSFKENEIIFIE
jgi:L1 cell adhesion molecule like protein